MNKNEIIEKQKKYLFSCVSTYYDEPLVVDHAKDQYVYDAEGKEFLDFFGGILTVSVGHCNEKVTKAIDEQLTKFSICRRSTPTSRRCSWRKSWRKLRRGVSRNLFLPIAARRQTRPRCCWRNSIPSAKTSSPCATPIAAVRTSL